MNNTKDSLRPASAPPAARIGVFDSGVGGLSILRALRARLPSASMVYVGDVAHAPYGDRSEDDVRERAARIVEWLTAEGATIIVIACNTATVLGIEALRARWPRLAFVGVEPGVKPAAARSSTRRIAVMATAATARSKRLKSLIARYGADAHFFVQPCPGLAEAIERGVLDGPALLDLLRPHCDAIRNVDVDTVVLGCTHYPFIEASIRALLCEGVTMIDTASAVAERSATLWEGSSLAVNASSTTRVLSTGATDTMRLLLAQCQGLERVEVEVLTMIPAALPG